ncbi:MAG: hypothetical protein PVI26_00950 [Chitinispirillia bacterium]|jgi:hypothetical protein
MTEKTDPAARLEFNIGKNTATLYLDNVNLHEGDKVGVMEKVGVSFQKKVPLLFQSPLKRSSIFLIKQIRILLQLFRSTLLQAEKSYPRMNLPGELTENICPGDSIS